MRGTGSKLVYILAGSVGIVILFSGSNIKTIFNLRNELNRYQRRVEILAEQNQKLRQEIDLINEKEEHLEYLARKKLGLIKPGETKYYIVYSTESLSSR